MLPLLRIAAVRSSAASVSFPLMMTTTGANPTPVMLRVGAPSPTYEPVRTLANALVAKRSKARTHRTRAQVRISVLPPLEVGEPRKGSNSYALQSRAHTPWNHGLAPGGFGGERVEI